MGLTSPDPSDGFFVFSTPAFCEAVNLTGDMRFSMMFSCDSVRQEI